MNRELFNAFVIRAWEVGDEATLAELRGEKDMARGGMSDLDYCANCWQKLDDEGECPQCDKCPTCGEGMDAHDMRQVNAGGTIGVCPGGN